MPGGGLVVEQVAGPEVVRDVQVGQPVTGQVSGRRPSVQPVESAYGIAFLTIW